MLPNGKLDRRALPGPDQTRLEPGQNFVAPRTQIEKVVATAWSEVLGVEQVSIYDDFFTMGGHSLLAMHVVSRLRTTLQAELPLRSFFEAPTIAGLAHIIMQLRSNGIGHHTPSIRSISREKHRVTLSSISSSPGRSSSQNE